MSDSLKRYSKFSGVLFKIPVGAAFIVGLQRVESLVFGILW